MFLPSFWDWEKGEKLDYFHNGNPRYTRITAMEYLNGQDCSLLLTATGKGHCTAPCVPRGAGDTASTAELLWTPSVQELQFCSLSCARAGQAGLSPRASGGSEFPCSPCLTWAAGDLAQRLCRAESDLLLPKEPLQGWH